MAVDGYSLLPATSDDEAQNLATPQTWRVAHKCKLMLLPWCLVLAFAVLVVVQGLQITNDPPHPQWRPWFFGPGLTPEALVWSAWTQAIILPLLGALGMSSCILRLGRSKSSRMEMMSLMASLMIFFHLLLWEYVFLDGFTQHPTEELQSMVIEGSWAYSHLSHLLLATHKLLLLGRRMAAYFSPWTWMLWCMLRTLIAMKLGWASWIKAGVAIGSWPVLILSTGLEAWALWAAAEEGSQFREIRKNWAGLVDREVFFLRCAAVFSIWDPVYMLLAEHFIVPMIGFAWYLAFNALFVLLTIHLLGYEADTLQDIGDMARLQGKRIAFPGKVNPEAKDCIVSFPGKYSKDPWHPLAILCFFP